MKILIALFITWYENGRRHWLSPLLGLLFAFAFPPFNHETHPALAFFPLSGFVILIPLFALSLQRKRGKAILDIYLFGIGASFSQYYWVANVSAEGLRHVILLGSLGVSLYLAVYYLIPGLFFRIIFKRFPRFYILIFPSLWVLIEFLRGWGEISFPWNFLGYTFVPLSALAQLSSLYGVYGLSFIVAVGNVLVWDLLCSYYKKENISQKWLHVCVFAFLLIGASGWGAWRMSRPLPDGTAVDIALLQTNMDQGHWGNGSLDSCLAITGAMVYEASKQKPDLIILAESALFCYLVRRPAIRRTVQKWSESIRIPIITGTLHWERSADAKKKLKYDVYNTAFFIDTGKASFEPYFKIRLLPFSEVMPFEAQFPILNRLNLGEADFSRGTEETIFSIGNNIKAGPFICFEILFPDFVRNRVQKGTNLLVNITNDGWWGRSNGAFHHAAMTRMRCIENGVPMARCANSGISMFVDQYGRVLDNTGLYERRILTGTLWVARIDTFYTRCGDWPLYVFLFIVCEALFFALAQNWIKRRKEKVEKK